MLLGTLLLTSNEYGGTWIDDENVNECLVDMYFYMLYNGENNELKKEKLFHEFEKKYNELNKEQQEMVKQEYINIIETQEKNRRKVKRKGMNNYE